VVLALAGRRIDAPDVTQAVFPYANIERVQKRIELLMRQQSVTALVCSAACGADLVALKTAGALGLRKRIVLPFDPDRFRETSVIDRPGEWGSIFDEALAEAKSSGDLVDLNHEAGGQDADDQAYVETNHAILHHASLLAAPAGERIGAAIVWNGVWRAESDMTRLFDQAAKALGLEVFEVSTL
jgi:hypothetical protein